MKPPLESDILTACMEFLKLSGIFAFRVNCGAIASEHKGKRRFLRFTGINGVSDILGVLPESGRMLAVETKRPGRKPTPEQAAFLDAVNRSGGLAFVAHSVDELIAALAAERVV